MKSKKRILSGIQPSGKAHLGNYFAMMKRMIEYQNENELFCFIASYHSLTSFTDPKLLNENIYDLAIDFLALGLDPNKSTFWVQSDVPQVLELTWLLANQITVPQLELAHSYKDKVASGIIPNAGLFIYPLLMSADILAFGTERVPVGKDQKQHLEMARDIARRFNNNYGNVFIIPEIDIIENLEAIKGVDGRKMSKSYNNAIYPFAPEKDLKKSIMSIVTDSKGVNEKKDPDNSIIFNLTKLFLNSEEECNLLKERFATPGTGYGTFKQELFEIIMEYFSNARSKRDNLKKNPSYIKDILLDGAKKAGVVANQYLERARGVVGLNN